MRTRLVKLIVWIQLFLLGAHGFLYLTWRFFAPGGRAPALIWVAALLSISFIAASLAAFRWASRPVRWLYQLAAFWLGLAGYLTLAAMACWPVFGLLLLTTGLRNPRPIGVTLFGAASIVAVYGVINAALPRVRHVAITLERLPAAWQGRRVALVSDLHLGHVRGAGFARRIVRKLKSLRTAAVFIAGDLYDGTAADLARLSQPWTEMTTPIYFVAGNHEEFRDPAPYFDALSAVGVRVLRDELIESDGLQLAGVDFRGGTRAAALAQQLAALGLDRARPSILLRHAPDHLEVVEDAGISLQLSGHTHQGQMFPFTLLVKRIYGRFAYGLQRRGDLQVYVSSGVGTWGPPLRVATRPEIVVLELRGGP